MGQFVTFWLLFGQRFYTFGLLFMPTSGHAVETEVDHFVLEATKCKLFNFGFSQITSYPFRQKYLVKLKVKSVWRKCKNETVVVFRGKKLYPMQLFGFMFARLGICAKRIWANCNSAKWSIAFWLFWPNFCIIHFIIFYLISALSAFWLYLFSSVQQSGLLKIQFVGLTNFRHFS